MKPGATIVVGMSGGVDSSVAALLLKRQGYRVIGVFMKNWEEDPETALESACSAAEDFDDVRRVCDRLDLPYYAVGFEEEYRRQVFASFVADYEAGFTPNPDVLCNREIKFNLFLKKAFELGAEALATGHYCRTENGRLLRGADPSKDQSYFVHTLSKTALEKVRFPIGQLLKSEVRELAREAGLATHGKKDSTGICFIGERDFKTFLGRYVALRPGELKRLDGTVVGQHSGAAYYTMGQRRGLGLGGEGARWFVVGKDVAANVVYVERGDDHPALYADELTANEASWVDGAAPAANFRCTAKIRYRQADQACAVRTLADGRLAVVFDEPQRAIAPRQAVVFYDGERCLGGAMIEGAGPSYHVQRRVVTGLLRSSCRPAPTEARLTP